MLSLRPFFGLAALLCLGLMTSASLPAATFHVAPGGADNQPGTQEKPFATLEAARDAARKASDGPHRIVVAPGQYFLARPLELSAVDNGLTIEAAKPGTATLYGGKQVTGWRRDGEKFWSADLPGVKEGQWDFRALVVNGRMPNRARFPATGTFLNRGTWSLRLLPAVGGFWERKPTQEELTTMPYDPKDLPESLEVKNAEVRMYHMWDESLLGVARNDLQKHALIFSSPAIWPAGALGIKKYIVFNTREGMTEPGQWYLDRAAGKLVYWPLADEDMTKVQVVAPSMERIVFINGNAKKPAEKITLRGLRLAATTTPLKPGSFGAGAFEGAVTFLFARQCSAEGLDIGNVGGVAFRGYQFTQGRVAGCEMHHVGACGMKFDGADSTIEGNHIHHVGIYYPSAAALMAGGSKLQVCRNEIHDGPYSGIIGGGKDHLFEANLIYRVMREMHDGAAIYGNLANCTLRRNVVRDVTPVGEGFGVSAYYLDEGAHDCIVENNVAIGVARPSHNHIARNVIVRDNVFIAEKDMTLSFQRSAQCSVERNTLIVPGQLRVDQPSGVKVWKGNVIFRGGTDAKGQPQAFTIDDTMPPAKTPARKPYPVEAQRLAKPPVLDGSITLEEWPGKIQALDREPSRQAACGAPVFAKFGYDDQCLYIEVTATLFDNAQLKLGSTWKQDDGAEIAIVGRTADGRATTLLLRGFAGGQQQCGVAGDAAPNAATQLQQAVRFAAKVATTPAGKPRSWCGEWAIPWKALGLKPAAGAKWPFNIAVYTGQYAEWHCWEGTLGENAQLDQAGTLQLK